MVLSLRWPPFQGSEEYFNKSKTLLGLNRVLKILKSLSFDLSEILSQHIAQIGDLNQNFRLKYFCEF